MYLDGFRIDDNVEAVQNDAIRFHFALDVDGYPTQNSEIAFLHDGKETDIVTNGQNISR